jgi:hypothetical protein
MVVEMNTINIKTQESNPKNHFDILSQDFDGGGFYGLEYILEDFFQSTTVKNSVTDSPSADWFGLYH